MGNFPCEAITYKIIGVCYDVFNELGYGHREKYYHRAIAEGCSNEGLAFEREKKIKLCYSGKDVGYQSLDFLIESKVILEVKVYPYFKVKKSHYRQVLDYLESTDARVALLVYFTKDGVKIKRIVK